MIYIPEPTTERAPVSAVFAAWVRAEAESAITGEIWAEQALAGRLVAEPSRDLRDLAAKIVAACAWDDTVAFDGPLGTAILAEARALVVL